MYSGTMSQWCAAKWGHLGPVGDFLGLGTTRKERRMFTRYYERRANGAIDGVLKKNKLVETIGNA